MRYLEDFYKTLKRDRAGSLVKVEQVKRPHAKEYLGKLAKEGLIERVTWGWYWVPAPVKDVWDFLAKDRNCKVIAVQTAAGFWNHDFIHRNVYRIKVRDESYGKALEAFGRVRGWDIVSEPLDRHTKCVRVGRLLVETINQSIVDCIQDWAFADAFAALYANRRRIDWDELLRESYWKRVSGTRVRTRQVLEYAGSLFNELSGQNIFKAVKPRLEDDFIRREIEEGVEKVVEIA
ncbi:MAG: hypothetical protein HY695_30145 [Deltaproteobacteria bacterium]|nr:hypothetical protein [Deltaproteobacteria bacterium]